MNDVGLCVMFGVIVLNVGEFFVGGYLNFLFFF